MTQPTKPIAEVKYGMIVASIWRNETEKGVRHNVTLSRLYKTEEGQWKRSDSFGRDDLLLVAKVADLAHSKIIALSERPDEERV